MTDQDGIYNCDDEKDLGAMLHRLFMEGNDEVEVMHPTEGMIVVTRKDFEKHLANIKRVNELSPAGRIEERKKLKARKKQMQIRFRTALIEAPVHKVDMDSGEFGTDIEGNKLPVDGMTFVATKDYPKGTQLVDDEVGCFYDLDEKITPIRITQ